MSSALLVIPVAFTAGLFGSLHCIAMCGGMSGLFAVHQSAKQTRNSLPLALSYNAGRLSSYALIGLVAGLAGSGLLGLLPSLVLPLRLLAALAMLGMAVQLLTGKASPLERAGSSVWKRVSPLARRFLPTDTKAKALGLGLLWGFLPCGLVYSVLLITLASADPLLGALGMASFGIGTLPAMLLSGLGAWRFSAIIGRNRRSAAALLVLMAVLTAAMPLSHLGQHDSGTATQHHNH